jgi:6-phosphofructokinase 2
MALVRRGAARMVAVTLGADGALLATEDGVLRVPAMEEAMHSSVGAGDAFLAAATLALACGGTPAARPAAVTRRRGRHRLRRHG